MTTQRSQPLVDSYGAHALTLDHLGGLIGQFLGGDPAKAPRRRSSPRPSTTGRRCGWLGCSKPMKSICRRRSWRCLCRLCLLERSMRVDQLIPLFLCSPAVHFRTTGELIS